MKFILFLVFITGGLIWILKLSTDSLPGDYLYFAKEATEELQKTTTELNGIKRALLYIEFANKRLDEMEKLEKKEANPKLLNLTAQAYLENVESALREGNASRNRLDNVTGIFDKLKKLREKSKVIFQKILDKTPSPEFYSILQIREISEHAIETFIK